MTRAAAPHKTRDPVSEAAGEEVEWQLEAASLEPVERWIEARPPVPRLAVEPQGERRITDTYLETEDWSFHHAGYALRIRRQDGTVEATLKSLDPGTGSARRRREIVEPLAHATTGALGRAAGPVGTRVRLIAGRRTLRPLVTIRTRRRVYGLRLGRAAAGELALDAITLPGAGGRGRRLARVEVEVGGVAPAALEPFVEALRAACHLAPATVSKLEAALRARGIEAAPPLDLGPTAVDAFLSIGEVAFAALRRHLAIFLAREPGTRLGEDVEALHDMRVAARRLRAALRLFEPYLPAGAARLRRELGWVDGALGAVRDRDVQLARLAEWRETVGARTGGALAAVLRDQREAARARLLQVLDSRRYERLVGGSVAMLRRGPLRRAAAARQPVLAVAPDLIRRRYRAVKRKGDRITPQAAAGDYHALRIRCRRLRYALELHRDVYGRRVQLFVRSLIALQDLLGRHQDAEVARAWLGAIGREGGRPLPRRTALAIGRLAERYAEEARELRRRFPKLYRRIRGKRWRRLRRFMEECR
jgi:triphosphatase